MLRQLIDRPVAVTMVLCSIVVLGVVSLTRLPVSLIPEVDAPYISVQVDAPQMSARELDESVAGPLARDFRQIDGIVSVESESKDGSSRIRLSFDHSDNINYRFIEVNEKLDRAMGSLPDIDRPKVLKAGASDIPAFYINMTGEGDFLALSRFAREVIVRRLEQLEQVSMVDISGLEEAQIIIIPDKAAMARHGIDISRLESLVRNADIRLGNLTIRQGQYRYGVRFQSNVSGKEDIENLWLNLDGRLVALKDIASVEVQPAPRSGILTSDGSPAVCLAVFKQSDARMADLRKAVRELMEAFGKDYPEIDFTLTRDQTLLLDYSINSLLQNIIIGILLACAVIFLFMKDFRSSLLVAITIPVSMVFSMLVFRLTGMTLNIISLSGLLLGVGMMTDNTLILVDNITGRWQRGDDLRKAILEGTKEVSAPMLSSILTTCAVFIPLVSINGMAGSLFKDQALAIAIVLFTSWIVTGTAVPVYYLCFYKKESGPGAASKRLSLAMALERWDMKWSKWFLAHTGAAWTIVLLSVAGSALCFALMPKTSLPEITRTDMVLKVDWNSSLSPQENLKRCSALEETAGATHSTVMAGVQQFALDHSGDTGAGEAWIYMDFGEEKALRKAQAAIRSFMEENYPTSPYSFQPAGNLFDLVFGGGEPSLVARIRPVGAGGMEVSALHECVGALRESFSEVETGDIPVKEQVVYVADPEAMALYGVGFPALETALRSLLGSYKLLSIVQGSGSIPVVLSSDRPELFRMLESSTVKGAEADIPLSVLMRQSSSSDLKTIVSGPEGEYYPLPLDLPSGKVTKAISTVREIVARDGRFEVGFSGSWFSTMKMIRELILTILVAIALLYLILAAQFESFLQPVIILLELFIDIFAALAVLWICGGTVNIISLTGLVVITGIVINDSILKIDTTNRLRRQGMHIDEAILTAGSRRVKAIIMTSLTTILAVSPFLVRGNIGADLQYPMAVVIIAGLVAGTLVSLFIVPALYKSLNRN